MADDLLDRLERAYASIPVGDPREDGALCGPLISVDAFERMQAALDRARSEGATVSGGDRELADRFPDARYVRPAIARMPSHSSLMHEETFAPLLYAVTYRDLDDAVAMHNEVPQGLASCIFTTDLREAIAKVLSGQEDPEEPPFLPVLLNGRQLFHQWPSHWTPPDV